MNSLRLSPSLFCAASCAALLIFTVNAAGAGKRTNPTSKIYVVETKGDSNIDTGEKIESLSPKSVFAAEGAKFETKANSTSTLVFSNGTAILVNANTRLEIKKFLQEPFTPNRNDLDNEPSISQTAVKLSEGSVGVCTSRLVAGSSMVYNTPQGSINIRGHKVMIEVGQNETRVTLLEGDVTVIGEGGGSGQTLRGGQQAVITKTAPDQPAVVTINQIDDATTKRIDDQVSLACIARRTVYFEVATRPGQAGTEDTTELSAVEVAPTTPPTQFTVSPSRITP